MAVIKPRAHPIQLGKRFYNGVLLRPCLANSRILRVVMQLISAVSHCQSVKGITNVITRYNVV